MSSPARILIADDEPDLIEDYQCALAVPDAGAANLRLVELQDELFGPQGSAGSLPQVELVAVNQGEAAIQAVARGRDQSLPFSAAFLDVRMPPGINGLEAGKRIRRLDQDVPIVFVSGYSDVSKGDLMQSVPPSSKVHYFSKPLSFSDLAQEVTEIVRAARAMRDP